MAQVAIVSINDLGMAMRVDAQFYQPQYLIDTTTGKWLKIRDILKKCEYGLSLSMNDEKKGVTMFKMDDIAHTFLVADNARYSEVNENERKRFKCKVNDVFFNRVNSEEFVGRTGIFKDPTLDAVFASYLIRLQTKNDLVTPQFLNIFLNSKYGQKQIDRYKRRAVNQANINAQELQEFFIPILPSDFQKHINKLVDSSWLNLESSKSLYAQSEQLLLKELDLEEFAPEWQAGYETKFNQLFETERIDAEYYQPKYEELVKKICNAKQFKKLGDLSEPSKEKVNISPDQTYKYIEIGDVNVSNGELAYNQIRGEELPAKAKKARQSNSLLVSTVRPTRGAIGIVPKGWKDNFVVSGAFSVFNQHLVSPFYLQVVLRSIIGRLQLERQCTGVSYPTVKDEDTSNIVIPILEDSKINKIHNWMIEANKALHESRQLLEQAKHEVEEMIESATK